MKEMIPAEKLETIKSSKEIKVVLNILSSFISGKKFGEFDTKTVMYLMDCEAKIQEMIDGNYSEESIKFLMDSIEYIIKLFSKAKSDIEKSI